MGYPSVPPPSDPLPLSDHYDYQNPTIYATRGNDFSDRLYRLLNPLNRAKHFLVLFGLMAVSLTCLFSLGGSGPRRRLVGPKEAQLRAELKSTYELLASYGTP